MLPRGAVDPDGLGVVDHDAVRVDDSRGHGGLCVLEPGVETRGVAVQADGLAGLVEGGLGDGVVAGEELELHHVAHGGLEVVRREGEGAVLADADDVDRHAGWCLGFWGG